MKRWIVLALCGIVVAAGCRRGEGEGPGARDTLSIEVPAGVDESMERGARRIGGRVGEALENTGEAIERAGERLREEAGEPVTTGDTL